MKFITEHYLTIKFPSGTTIFHKFCSISLHVCVGQGGTIFRCMYVWGKVGQYFVACMCGARWDNMSLHVCVGQDGTV